MIEASTSLVGAERFRGLHYARYGSGAPVIALHGFGQTSYSWRHLVARLPNDFELFVFDLRGCGNSEKARDEHYSLHDHATNIHEFIAAYDLNEVTIIGHSLGGGIAILIALDLLKEGNRLRSLVLIDSIAFPQGIPWFMRFMRNPILARPILASLSPRLSVKIVMFWAFYDRSKIDDEAIGHYAQNLSTPLGQYAQIKTAQHIIPPDLDRIIADYHRICVPTLIVWGSDDRIIPLEIGAKLKNAIPSSQLVIVPECGHIPHEEQPNIAIPVICEFLTKTTEENPKAALQT